jgi:hypothetical protein
MSPEHKPSIIIRVDLLAGQAAQQADTKQAPAGHRAERTTRKNLRRPQHETQPASVLSPATITRAETSAILDRIFTQEAPSNEAPETLKTGQAPQGGTLDIKPGTSAETGELNASRLLQFAYYYQAQPPFNPSASPQETLKNADALIYYLQYGLQKLKIPLPNRIDENHKKLKQVMEAYGAEYMRMIKEAPQAIASLNENYLRHPKTIALCRDLTDDLIRFGQDVYGELAEIREKEERLAILESPAGRQVQREHPLLGQTFEAAPDALETAKKDYHERLRVSVEKELASIYANTAGDPNFSSQFAPKNVAGFVVPETFNRISTLVDGLTLSAEEKAEVQSALPSAILNQHATADNGNINVVLGTDKPLPQRMGNEFETTVTQALLKAKLLCLAAYEHEDQIRWYLQNYARAIKGARIQCLGDANSAVTLSYRKDGAQLTDENFYGPVSENDEAFFGQLLAVMQKNGHARLLKRELEIGIQQQQSGSKTFVAFGLAADVQRYFMRTLDRLAATQKETGSSPSDMPPPQQLSTVPEAINAITNLRAYAVSVIAEKESALAQKNAVGDINRLANMQNLQEANERANRAEKETRAMREQVKAWLTSVRKETGFFSRGVREQIDRVLDEIDATPKREG